MTLVNTRAAFEKAVTDAVKDVDPTVKMVYDNVGYTRPGKTVKYIVMTVNFGQATQQAQAPSQQQRPVGQLQCCLLYTSPSPRDVEESRMPSSA